MKKKSLIEKALEIDAYNRPADAPVTATKEELELIFAYLKGEITAHQLRTVKKLGSSEYQGWINRLLHAGIRQNLLEISH